MHPCATPIVRLERPLALGHGCISSSCGHHICAQAHPAAVGKFCCLARNRRAPPDLRMETFGFAAVSPTSGRLFEGTDRDSLGQTCYRPVTPWSGTGGRPPILTTPGPADHKQRGSAAIATETFTSMLPNGWNSETKLLASGRSCSRRNGTQANATTTRAATLCATRETFAGRLPTKAVRLSTPVDNYVDRLPSLRYLLLVSSVRNRGIRR